jgi:MFS transporter, DHA1 family, tetracycline resistance protein
LYDTDPSKGDLMRKFIFAAAPLFLVLFIDSMGLGLVFPILNSLVFDPQAHFISNSISLDTRNFLFGLTIGIYMLCWFFGAAFLGDISDQIGRKKSLLICLVGAFIGYVISAIAVILGSFGLLLTGRIIAGFTAGSQSIAQAAIVDLSEPQHKAKNLGLILFFCSLGFVVGPLIGGVLSDAKLAHWFNFALPFYFAAAVSLINAGLLLVFFQESFIKVHNIRFRLYYALEIFISAFKREKIRELSIVLLAMIFGWSGFYSFISMYLLRVYHFSALENGLYMGLMGVGFGIGTGLLVEPVTKRFSLKQSVMLGCAVIAAGIVLTVMATSLISLWLDVLVVALGISVAYSTILTLFSNMVDANSQGWVMGITGSIMAFAFALNGLLMGILADLSPRTPLIIAATSLTLSIFLMKFLYQDSPTVSSD